MEIIKIIKNNKIIFTEEVPVTWQCVVRGGGVLQEIKFAKTYSDSKGSDKMLKTRLKIHCT